MFSNILSNDEENSKLQLDPKIWNSFFCLIDHQKKNARKMGKGILDFLSEKKEFVDLLFKNHIWLEKLTFWLNNSDSSSVNFINLIHNFLKI